MPLCDFIAISDAPDEIKSAAKNLSSTSLLLLNISLSKPMTQNFHWCYVYDKELPPARITQIAHFSQSIRPSSFLQCEIYHNNRNLSEFSIDKIAISLIKNKIIEKDNEISEIKTHNVKNANVICDLYREESLEKIYHWLARNGMYRYADDTKPYKIWNTLEKLREPQQSPPQVILAGRFGEWKYFWSDDCVLSGIRAANMITNY